MNILSKSFLILACIFGLVFGVVVQTISDRAVPPLTPKAGIAGGQPTIDTGGQPTTDTGRQPPIPDGGSAGTLSGHWSGALKLETGDIIAFEEIIIGLDSGGYLHGVASFHNDPVGRFEGSQQGNHFGFRLIYNSGTNSLQNRDYTEIVFDGNIGDNQASGTVQFTDEYRKIFNGTFTFVPYTFGAPAPAPPSDSSSNTVEGAWKGEFLPRDHLSYPLTLNLNHQSTPIIASDGGYYNGANIVGTGTIEGKPYQVQGTIAGSSYNLEIGDSSTTLNISGQVTQDAMVGRAKLNTGEEIAPGLYKRFGEIKLTR